MDIRTRRLTRDDEPFLWDALYHAVHVAQGEAPPPRETVRRPELARYVAEWMERPDDLGVGAEAEGALVGAAWLRRWTGPDRGYGYVDAATPELSMALLPGWRGRGTGTVLLRRLLAEADEQFGAVSLSVSLANPAQRLYRREGFEPIGKPKGGSVTMRRRAPSP